MKEREEFLPLGTVVLLDGATRKLVIIGFAAIEKGNTKIWDYIGCAYPVGIVSNDSTLLFDRNQIAKVVSIGYSDDEDKEFREMLLKDLKDKNNG